MIKQHIVNFLRNIRLLVFTDYLKFICSYLINYKANKEFKIKHQGVKLPPNFILYESFGMLKYNSYYNNGKKTAEYLIDLLKKHTTSKKLDICEWGCGPARVLRHFKDIFNSQGYDVNCYGSDYNKSTIAWCKDNIESANFYLNELVPPLPFDNEKFDILYSISVFTHLSEELQKEWFKDCIRVLKQGGLFLFTIHGDMQSQNLLESEKKQFENRGIYVRGKVKEGKRNFTSYNSEWYVRNVLLEDAEVISHLKSNSVKDQDLWIVRKK